MLAKNQNIRLLYALSLGLLGTMAAQYCNAQGSGGLQPKVKCAAMNGLKIPASAIALQTGGATITSTSLEPGTGKNVPEPDFIPEYCKLDGKLAPVDPQSPAIYFRVVIPTTWNQKSWQIGGNGMNGFIPNLAKIVRDRPGSPLGPAYPPNAPFPISQGYALYGSDSGHGGPDAPTPDQMVQGQVAQQGKAGQGPPVMPRMDFSWMGNKESLHNFAYEQLKKTHDAAFFVIKSMYGKTPKVSYFGGESQGGRDALGAIARYGADYDGVLVSVPLAYFTGVIASPAYRMKLQTAPDAWVPPSKAAAIQRETLRLCDGLDGIEDGVISNYYACNRKLDPSITPNPLAKLRCPDGKDTGDDCLSDAQIDTVNAFHAPMKWGFPMANGETEWPGEPAGSEAMPGWLLTAVKPEAGKAPPGPINPSMMFGLIAGSNKYDFMTQSYAELKEPLQNFSALLDVPADWSKLLSHGGKIILHSAANDYITNSRGHMKLYEEVLKKNGATVIEKSVRFYVTPQANHGSVGTSATTNKPTPRFMDLVGALEGWVEKGVTPEVIPQTLMDSTPPYTLQRSRPLCRYPSYPRYKGGDADRLESYVCTKPE
jgi:Tannase and feruloyl esterase